MGRADGWREPPLRFPFTWHSSVARHSAPAGSAQALAWALLGEQAPWHGSDALQRAARWRAAPTVQYAMWHLQTESAQRSSLKACPAVRLEVFRRAPAHDLFVCACGPLLVSNYMAALCCCPQTVALLAAFRAVLLWRRAACRSTARQVASEPQAEQS